VLVGIFESCAIRAIIAPVHSPAVSRPLRQTRYMTLTSLLRRPFVLGEVDRWLVSDEFFFGGSENRCVY